MSSVRRSGADSRALASSLRAESDEYTRALVCMAHFLSQPIRERPRVKLDMRRGTR